MVAFKSPNADTASTLTEAILMEKIRFRFDGGMAVNHELNFYEAGRF